MLLLLLLVAVVVVMMMVVIAGSIHRVCGCIYAVGVGNMV